ncbi:MAG: hypothetical protein RL557_184, partial [archaeon]
SLGNLLFIQNIYPEIEPLLPLFFGAVQREGEYNIIMEDYSQNKRRIVSEAYYDTALIPHTLKLYVDSLESLANNFGSFKNENRETEIRLMDFNNIQWSDGILENSFRFRWKHIEENVEQLAPYLIRS